MEIIPDEEVAIYAIPLAVKSPSIFDWKIHKKGRKSYYQIIRADAKSQMYMIFSHMLKSFDKEDLETFYKLEKAKYESTRPVEDLDLIFVLVEKKYPFTPSTLSMMLEKKLMIDYESEMPYQLLKFIIKQLKNLLDAVRITAAQVYVNTALMKLVLLISRSELPSITASTFTTRSPNNTPLTNRASTSANPYRMISPTFVKANYKVLESLLRDRRRQVHNKDLRTELDYYSEEYDEDRKMSRAERESNDRRPSERKVEEGGSHRGNLPPPLAAYLGRNENGQPLQSTLTSIYGGNQPSTNLGGNLTPNDCTGCVTPFVYWIEDYPFLDGLKMPSHVDLPTTYKGLMEKTYTWIEAKEFATNIAPSDHR
ncbi:hypothetical protein Tco_0268272 [Tanacetum coccineum]